LQAIVSAHENEQESYLQELGGTREREEKFLLREAELDVLLKEREAAIDDLKLQLDFAGQDTELQLKEMVTCIF